MPENVLDGTVWLDMGGGQQIHVLYVEGFEISAFEREFGRHVAVFHPLAGFEALEKRLVERGAEMIAPIRSTPFKRFFFREPINGYVFEVIDRDRTARQDGP